MLAFLPLDVLDEIWDHIESVSEGFLPTLPPLYVRRVHLSFKGSDLFCGFKSILFIENPVSK